MASIINASSTGSGGIVQTADASGVLQLQSNGTVALNVDTSANVSIGTTTANSITGNSNARYFAVQGDGTLSSADGRIILSNPRAYASISSGATTAGRVFFQLTNGSGGTIADAANIDAIASGSGGASGYGLDIRFLPKADNGTSSEAARIKSGGTFILAGGSTSATGTGITFPATQSTSSDANTLDDYEEGTWTPTDGSGAGLTFSNTSGNCIYTKIGRNVIASFRVTYPATANASFAYIGGLPFATANTTVNVHPVVFSEQSYSAGVTGNIGTNDTKFLILTTSGGSVAIATNANVSGKDFRGVAIYQTA